MIMNQTIVTITATGIELTTAIRDYTEKRLESLSKFTGGTPTIVAEIGKTIGHHVHGDIFKASVTVRTPLGKEYFAASEKPDLYEAVDDVREELRNRLTDGKKKNESLYKKGARHIKRILKGFR